jgi:acetyl esterase/lipase
MIVITKKSSCSVLLFLTALTLLSNSCTSTFKKTARPSAPHYNVQIIKDVNYLPDGRAEKADLYLPKRPDETVSPVVVLIHGGGWFGGDKAKKRREASIAEFLAQNGYVAISINYRLSTKTQPSWPQNLYDCKVAVRFLRKNAALYRIDPQKIALVGFSAGAHLAALTALTANDKDLAGNDLYLSVPSDVRAVVCFYGAYILSNVENRDMTRQMLGVSLQQDPNLWSLASPASHITRDAPPFLLIHGSADKIVNIKHSSQMHSLLLQAGADSMFLPIKNAPHSFDLHPSGRDLSKILLTWLNAKLNRSNNSIGGHIK